MTGRSKLPACAMERERVFLIRWWRCSRISLPRIILFTGNTTLGIVVTNARLSKTQLTKVAGMAHNGYARAIRPVHTNADGDSIYALSTGGQAGDVNVVGAMAAWVMERAIVRAVRAAGVPMDFWPAAPAEF